MRRSLREVLADSHIAAITIVSLLLGAIDCAFQAIWWPLIQLAEFLATAVAILDIPFISWGRNRYLLINACIYLLSAVMNLAGAWFLSRWVFGVGPFRSLSSYHNKLIGRTHV